MVLRLCCQRVKSATLYDARIRFGLVVNAAGYSGHVQISDNADRLGE